jgi:hypothetical protein
MTSISKFLNKSFIPNDEQTDCITKINKFILEHRYFSKLLINGSAGTGKTTIIISTIVDSLISQILENINEIKILVNSNSWDKLENLSDFIIAAPTNKAKDVLVNKYNLYIDSLINNLSNGFVIDKLLLNKILDRKITFLTVSQVLSINRVINELGEEEFTKGNDKKILEKYKKSAFAKTLIIVDECSMIDTNTSRLLSLIICPIIYIGDYCQLPPVKEDLSPTFEISADNTIKLCKVERCKNDITLIANKLRDKIYDSSLDFNLLKYISPDLIIYNKKFSKWMESYVNDIKKKQIDILQIIENNSTKSNNGDNNNKSTIQTYDTMALGWTNKCTTYLNKKIRSQLFENIKNIDDVYIIKGDKLLIKAPYYKYNTKLCSSSIVYISSVKETKFKPLNFKDWCKIITTCNDISNKKANSNKPNTILDIDISDILLEDSKPSKPSKPSNPTNPTNSTKSSKTILDYFDKNDETSAKNDIPIIKSNSGYDNDNDNTYSELLLHRKLFFIYHQLNTIINNDIYDFTDEISLKHNLLVHNINLLEINKISNQLDRANKYTIWHKAMSIKLFGIPNDNIMCKKCAFFVKKFADQMKTSSYISDFITVTDGLEFDMLLCDLVSFNMNSNCCVSRDIPIMNMLNTNNTEKIDTIKNIIRNSFETKIMLSRQDEKELNAINKTLNEDGANSGEKTNKYITMSQLFGHYLSHIITSSYLDIDYGYALTVHKSQGSTYEDVYVEYNNILSNRKEIEKLKLLYTAITRSANKLYVYN